MLSNTCCTILKVLWKSMSNINCLVNSILQNIDFAVVVFKRKIFIQVWNNVRLIEDQFISVYQLL